MARWFTLVCCFITILSCSSSAWAVESTCSKLPDSASESSENNQEIDEDCGESEKLLPYSQETDDLDKAFWPTLSITIHSTLKSWVIIAKPRAPPKVLSLTKLHCCFLE